MANAIGTNKKRIINTKPLGKRWGRIVEEMVMKEGADLARAQLKTGSPTSKDQVVVQIPVTIYVGFPRRGKGIAGLQALHAQFAYLRWTTEALAPCVYALDQVPVNASAVRSLSRQGDSRTHQTELAQDGAPRWC